ncbi:helix-turn-helix transcriptional regulator [Streptomyces sp. NPDC004539]|uniref:response regulator transcription factor n=1 Tax=Streptomyces sp. NPDC004539 TaxID=3154280 RepID=UPI0033B9BB67
MRDAPATAEPQPPADDPVTSDALAQALWHLRMCERLLRGGPALSSAAIPPGMFTPQEARTAAYLAKGWSNQQIATALGLSPHTVKSHVRRVLHKLGATSRAEAVARLMEPHPAGDDAEH